MEKRLRHGDLNLWMWFCPEEISPKSELRSRSVQSSVQKLSQSDRVKLVSDLLNKFPYVLYRWGYGYLKVQRWICIRELDMMSSSRNGAQCAVMEVATGLRCFLVLPWIDFLYFFLSMIEVRILEWPRAYICQYRFSECIWSRRRKTPPSLPIDMFQEQHLCCRVYRRVHTFHPSYLVSNRNLFLQITYLLIAKRSAYFEKSIIKLSGNHNKHTQ